MKYYYLITLLTPLLGVYYACTNLSWKYRKQLLIFTIVLFAGSITMPEGVDGYKLQQAVYDHYSELPFIDWLYQLKQILILEPVYPTKGDVFTHVVSYIAGTVISFPGLYFLLASFAFSYYFINGLEKILKEVKIDKEKSLLILFIIVFVSYRFVDNFQSIRTPTGLWVLFNGVLGYIQSSKKKYLLLVLLAPAFHFMYFITVLPVFFILFFKPRFSFLFIIYIASFLISFNDTTLVNVFSTTKLGEDKVETYYKDSDSISKKDNNTINENFYKKYGRGWALTSSPHILLFSLSAFFFAYRKHFSRLETKTLSVGILLAILANLLDFVGAVYTRLMMNAGIYITATSVLMINSNLYSHKAIYKNIIIKALLVTSFISFSPLIIYVLANMLQYTSVFMISGSFFGFVEPFNLSIRELLGFFFNF